MSTVEGGIIPGQVENSSFTRAPLDASIQIGYRTPEVFVDAEATAAWFGGMFEAGAATGIGVTEYVDKRDAKGKLRVKTLPFIHIHSSDLSTLDTLHSLYGGQRDGRLWRKGGRVAAEIVASTLPYSVARKDHAEAMNNWLSATTVEEQVAIANALEGKEWQHRGNPEAYIDLLDNPTFVAGVLDSRAYVATRPARNHHTLYIQTTSKNVALLNALKEKFGGLVRVTEQAREVNHETVVFETKVDSYVWEAISSPAINVVKFCSPFIQRPLPEDWDYQRAVEEQEENKQLAEKVAAHVRWELEQLQGGTIPRISTYPELKSKFGIGPRKLANSLKTGLSLEEQKERKRKTKAFGKRQLDAVQALRIIAEIEEEVQSCLEGQLGSISFIDDLVERYGVSDRVLERTVLPFLRDDLRVARTRILRAQHVQDRSNSSSKKD